MLLTKHQNDVLDRLNKRDEYSTLKQSDVTRLLNTLIKKDKDLLKKEIPNFIQYEIINNSKIQNESEAIKFLSTKAKGGDKKVFFEVLDTVGLKSGKYDKKKKKEVIDLDEMDEKHTEDVKKPGSVATTLSLLDKESKGKSKIKETVIGAIKDKVTSEDFTKAPGSSFASKALFLEFPELEYISKASKAVGLGWSNDDTKYLQDALQGNVDNDSLSKRLSWIGKLIANPDKWGDAIAGMAGQAVENSEAYKFLKRTFNSVAGLGNDNAVKLAGDFKFGKEQIDDKGKKSNQIITTQKPEEQSKFGNVKPVIGQKLPETPEEKKMWDEAIKGAYQDGSSSAFIVGNDPEYTRKFKALYNKYHEGKDPNQSTSKDIYANMSPKEKSHFAQEISNITKESFIKKSIPATVDIGTRVTPEAIATMQSSDARELLKSFVSNTEMIDKRIQEFITRGQKFSDGTDPNKTRSDLLPALSNLKEQLADPSINTATPEIVKAMKDIITLLPFDMVVDSIPLSETANKVDVISKTMIETKETEPLPTIDSTGKTKPSTKDGKPQDPEEKAKSVDGSGATSQETGNDKYQRFRPNMGLEDVDEMEDTLIGTEQQQLTTNAVWTAFDLKPANYENGDDIKDNLCYGRVVDQYNLRFGETFNLPPIRNKNSFRKINNIRKRQKWRQDRRHTQYTGQHYALDYNQPDMVQQLNPQTYRSPRLHDIYEPQSHMVDAYNNHIFGRLSVDDGGVNFEEDSRVKNKLHRRMFYDNGQFNYNSRYPQFIEKAPENPYGLIERDALRKRINLRQYGAGNA